MEKYSVDVPSRTKVGVRYLQVDAGVRHWEDSQIHGEDDYESEELTQTKGPMMPCAVYEHGMWRWKPLIDLESGRIVNWMSGVMADVFYKICDDGVYTLLDENKKTVIEIESYVPKLLYPKTNEYGDYINLDINGNGYIDGWKCSQALIKELIEGDDDWKTKFFPYEDDLSDYKEEL